MTLKNGLLHGKSLGNRIVGYVWFSPEALEVTLGIDWDTVLDPQMHSYFKDRRYKIGYAQHVSLTEIATTKQDFIFSATLAHMLGELWEENIPLMIMAKAAVELHRMFKVDIPARLQENTPSLYQHMLDNRLDFSITDGNEKEWFDHFVGYVKRSFSMAAHHLPVRDTVLPPALM